MISNAINLPLFVTKRDKARVVFNGAPTFEGAVPNNADDSGINLLNGLVEVLTRFGVGRYLAWLNKCFFQVAMPESRDLFPLVWYRNDR